MVQVKTEGVHTGEFVVSESPGTISRSEVGGVVVTVPTARTLSPGHVLGRLATGKYVPYDNAGSDGSETARAILYDECNNSAGVAPADFKAVVLDFGCEVAKAGLAWESGVDAAGKTAAYADLAAFGIKARS